MRKSAQIDKKIVEEEDVDDHPEFVIDRDEKVELSMGVKDNEPYMDDADIVSDDGKIWVIILIIFCILCIT